MRNCLLELHYLLRSRIFGEQMMLYIFLIIITVFIHQVLSFENFLTIYSMVVNFGLIEIMILLPLMMGTSYLNHQVSIYNMNVSLYDYFLSRCTLFILINSMLYIAFTTMMPLVLNLPYSFTFDFAPKVLFVTLIAILLGYVFPLNQFNKLFLMLGTVITIGLFEMVLLHVFKDTFYVNITYLLLTMITFIIILQLCLRRPVIR